MAVFMPLSALFLGLVLSANFFITAKGDLAVATFDAFPPALPSPSVLGVPIVLGNNCYLIPMQFASNVFSSRFVGTQVELWQKTGVDIGFKEASFKFVSEEYVKSTSVDFPVLYHNGFFNSYYDTCNTTAAQMIRGIEEAKTANAVILSYSAWVSQYTALSKST